MSPIASGTLILILVTAAGVLQHGAATTSALSCVTPAPSSSTTTSTASTGGTTPSPFITPESICQDEYTACFTDLDCTACFGWQTEHMSKVLDCQERYVLVGTDVCSSLSHQICCPDEFMTANDCAGNTAFVDAMLCMNSYVSTASGEGECTTFSCLPASEQGDDDDGVSETAPPTAGLNSCTTETNACYEDTECMECIRASADVMICEPDAYQECVNDYVPGYTGDICESITPAICCPDEINGNGNACSENTLYISYQVCTLSAASASFGQACDDPVTTCENRSGGTENVDTDDDTAETNDELEGGEEEAPVGDDGVETSEETERDDDEAGTEGEDITTEEEEDSSGAAVAASTLLITVPTLVLGGAFLAAGPYEYLLAI